ncbi:MAG: class I SAM-dependent methyltransferase [Candidatus Bathyarchaeia archaeon]
MKEESEKAGVSLTAPITPIQQVRSFLEVSHETSGLLLDVGCGDGRYGGVIAHATAFEVVGVDVCFPPGRVSGVNYIKGDMLHLPFKDGVFKLVLAINILHHLEAGKSLGLQFVVERAISEVRRVSKPESNFLAIEQTGDNPLKRTFDMLWSVIPASFKRALGWPTEDPNWDLPQIHIHSEFLKNSIEKEGFKIIKEQRNCLLVCYLELIASMLSVARLLEPFFGSLQRAEIEVANKAGLARFSSSIALYLRRIE